MCNGLLLMQERGFELVFGKYSGGQTFLQDSNLANTSEERIQKSILIYS